MTNHSPSKKQIIYKELLFWGLPEIRNWQSRGFLWRINHWQSYLIAEFLHLIPNLILNSEFDEGDIWFINTDCRRFFSHGKAKTVNSYSVFENNVVELFTLIPIELKPKLEWAGPQRLTDDH